MKKKQPKTNTRRSAKKTARTVSKGAVASVPQPPPPAPKDNALPIHPAEAEQLGVIRSGQSLLTALPAVSLPDPLQTLYMGDAMILRRQLIRESAKDAASTMLADAAVTAFVQSRQAGQTLCGLLSEGAGKVAVERAETLSKIQDRAHRQMLSAIEALRRPGSGPVKMEIREVGTVENLNLGNQTVERGSSE